MMDRSIKPDNKCSICSGSGCMDFKGRKTVCECIIRRKAKQYLGPLYADIKYTSFTTFDGKNKFVYFEKDPIDRFRSLVKSYLLFHNIRLSHKSTLPYEIVQNFLTDHEIIKYGELIEVDFLVIYYISDPPNKLYGDLIQSILERRVMFDRSTWLFFTNSIKTDTPLALSSAP